MLSKFRVKEQNVETCEKTSGPETNKVPNENDPNEEKICRPQRKRKVNLNYINPATYVPTLKAPKKEVPVKNDPLKDVHVDQMIDYLDRQSRVDRQLLRMKNSKIAQERTSCKYARPQTAKTKKKKLRPYEYLKFLPISSADGSKEAFPSPPLLTPHSSESSDGDGSQEKSGVLGPPKLEPCKTEKEPVKLSFSGRYCKPNSAYYREFYTDLKKIPNILNKHKTKRKIIHKSESESKFETNEGGRSTSVKTVKKEAENTGNFHVGGSSPKIKQEPEKTAVGKSHQFLVTSYGGKTQPSKELEFSLDTMMKNAEKDKRVSQLQNRIPVCQDKIMKTVKELAREKKFVKFFQLNVGNKLIFIPTDGATVIPKAYVMDKSSEAAKSYTKSPSVQETAAIIQEPMDDTDNSDLPKITSVFSLSSDGDGSSAENSATSNGQGTHSNAAASPSANEESRPCMTNPDNKQKLKSLLNPDILKKQTTNKDYTNLQSLVNATVSKLCKYDMNPNDQTGHFDNTSASGSSADMVHNRKEDTVGVRDLVSEETRTQDLKTMVSSNGNIPDLGQLQPLEKVTQKNPPQPLSHTVKNVQNTSNYLIKVNPITKQKYLILPRSSTTTLNNNARVIVSSDSFGGKQQSLLVNSAFQFVDKKGTQGSYTQNSPVNSSISLTPIVSASQATPVLLFPNVSNKSVPYVPQSTASQVISFQASVASRTTPTSKVTTSYSAPGNSSSSSLTHTVKTTAIKSILSETPNLRSFLNMTTEGSPCKNDCTEHEDETDIVRSKTDKVSGAGSIGHEWVTVKSEPGDEHEFEASILTTIKKENNSDTESETETKDGEKYDEGISWRMPQFPDHHITSVHAGETDTNERIRQLREKLRAQQEECDNLKKTLLTQNEEI